MLPRRRFLLATAAAAGACSSDDGEAPPPAAGCVVERGELVAVVPFRDGGVAFGEKAGAGWDARLFFDLSTLGPDTLVVDNEDFYIRTELPDQLDLEAPWSLRVHGLVEEESLLDLEDLMPLVAPQGVHVLECSGNSDGGAFGLMSAAEWAGVPLTALLESLPIAADATRVLVSGFDGHSTPSQNNHSKPGASWIFTFDELAAAGAFLATEMNGVPLPPDHGEPVRLFVPGWYGCTCIKWVDAIELVDDDAPSTPQMREFASRTHQRGVPELARDFAPAILDQAAMPIRVEERRIDGETMYLVTGILWGGQRPTDALQISFDRGASWEPVAVCPPHEQNATWTLWEHVWRPRDAGSYVIRMGIADADIRTRRLDSGYYDRTVTVDGV
jgi:DMSO/TMAO reductase YedYZ molybdopterin-dependent catalytic subunit